MAPSSNTFLYNRKEKHMKSSAAFHYFIFPTSFVERWNARIATSFPSFSFSTSVFKIWKAEKLISFPSFSFSTLVFKRWKAEKRIRFPSFKLFIIRFFSSASYYKITLRPSSVVCRRPSHGPQPQPLELSLPNLVRMCLLAISPGHFLFFPKF